MIELVSENIWARLKRAAKSSNRPAAVAVAYFGKGASKLLPLPKGSKLVVDASERAVKSGQTCPAELKNLLEKKDVHIYSIINLHAKVFIIGATAFVGSTNVSHSSADSLKEAVIATTDPVTVKTARQFVKGLCLQELGPEELDRLQRMYRPTHTNGNGSKKRTRSKSRIRLELRKLLLLHLTLSNPPEGSESAQENGMEIAKKRMEKPRRHTVDYFWQPRRCIYKKGERIMQVLDEGDGRIMISPPGNIVYNRFWQRGTKKCTFIYIERPNKKRVAMEMLAKRIGKDSLKRLRRGGKTSGEWTERIETAWGD